MDQDTNNQVAPPAALDQPQNLSPIVPSTPSVPSMPAQLTPGVAADNDLIENEWVDIAKRIITENKDDPYNLSNAITLLRADYMKKRYGKDINVVG